MLERIPSLDFIPRELLHKIEKLMLAILVLIFADVFAKILRHIFFAKRHVSEQKSNKKKLLGLDPALIPILRGTLTATVYSVGVIASLEIVGLVSKTSMLALLGSAGLGAGFALKDLVSNTIAGITLLLSKPFKIGDYIESNSTGGTVKEVSVLTTKMETSDGLLLAMPNNLISTNPILNHSYNSKRRISIPLSLSYKEPLDKIMAVLEEIISNEPRFLKDPEAIIVVSDMKESCIQLQLRAWTLTDEYWDTYYDVMKKIKEATLQAGLELPVAQRHLPAISYVQVDNVPGTGESKT